MCVYSIKDLEQLSGIKAHTLRIWEQRYRFLSPSRTDTNIRYYNEEDLKLVLNISLLKDNGYKISRIVKMSGHELRNEALKLLERRLAYPEQIHSLMMAMIEFDESRLERIMATHVLQSGFEHVMMHLIFPFLNKMGILWQTGAITPAHEHFVSNIVRQKLLVAIDGQFDVSAENARKFLLFLHEDEMHEHALLFSQYIIKRRKHQVLYLGQNMPFSDLQTIYDLHKPEFLLTIFTSLPAQGLQEYIDNLAERFVDSTILISGGQISDRELIRPSNVVFINRLEGLMSFVDALES